MAIALFSKPVRHQRVVVVRGGGAGSASAADLLIGYCRSLPSSSGGSVHSPRYRRAARAEVTAANRNAQTGQRVKSLLSRYCADTNNQPEVACADRPGRLGWFQERCGLQTRLPAGPTSASQGCKPCSSSPKIVCSQRGVRSTAARTSRCCNGLSGSGRIGAERMIAKKLEHNIRALQSTSRSPETAFQGLLPMLGALVAP